MKCLNKKSDQVLIKNIKEKNCSDSLNELVNRHSGMCFTIGKKYVNNCGLDLQDLNDNRYWIIFNAANSFNAQKGSKFSTWLGNQIRYFCLNFRTKNNKLVSTDDATLEFLINTKTQKNNNSEIIETIIELFNQISDPNTKNAIYYRYFHNKERILNYSEIAQILNVTPQTVLNWHNKFINFAKKKLTNKKINANI